VWDNVLAFLGGAGIALLIAFILGLIIGLIKGWYD
jgi:hypothetical protein